jgi:hypothetical protein
MDNYPISLEGNSKELTAKKQTLKNSQHSPVVIKSWPKKREN